MHDHTKAHTVREATREARVSLSWLYKEIRERRVVKLALTGHGRKILIPSSEVDKLCTQTVGTKAIAVSAHVPVTVIPRPVVHSLKPFHKICDLNLYGRNLDKLPIHVIAMAAQAAAEHLARYDLQTKVGYPQIAGGEDYNDRTAMQTPGQKRRMAPHVTHPNGHGVGKKAFVSCHPHGRDCSDPTCEYGRTVKRPSASTQPELPLSIQ